MAIRDDLTNLDLVKNSKEEIDQLCYRKGEEFRRIKTNQVRNFFSGITHLKMLKKNEVDSEVLRNELVMMRPKLAYAKGRQKSIGPMYNFFNAAIQSVLDASDEKSFEIALDNFFFLSEALVAYHKFHGGTD